MKLPVCEPIIHAYSHQCSVYAVLSAYEEVEPWLRSNYVNLFALRNLYGSQREGTIDFFYHYYGDFLQYELSANPWILLNRYSRRVVMEKWGDFLQFVKERLENREYIYMTLNRQYIWGDENANYHPLLVYGYDDSTQTIFYGDNDKTGKYILQTMSYDRFNMAANNIPKIEDERADRPNGICCFSVRCYPKMISEDEVRYLFSVPKVNQDLYSYLNPWQYSPVYAYGIDCYMELEKYLRCAFDNGNTNIDIRGVSSIIDHKVLMEERLKYMHQHGHLSNDYYDYREVQNGLIKARNLMMKHSITGKVPMQKILNILANAKDKECVILRKVLLEIGSII